MTISLVVATRNRPEELERFLTSIANQSVTDFEVVIVDQSSDSVKASNEQLVAKTSAISSAKFNWLPVDFSGLSRSRNYGLSHITGSIVGFPDDDCWYHSDVLRDVVALFDNNHEYGFISGCYTEPGVNNSKFPSGRRVLADRVGAQMPSSVTFFVKREVLFDGEKWFDDRLGAGSEMPVGEETDLILRVIKRGVLGIYDSSLVIFHKINNSSLYDKRISLKREYARGYLFGKNIGSLHGIIVEFLAAIRLAFSAKEGAHAMCSRLGGLIFGIKSARSWF
jgi:glycosyltransferase involved in cell wall biosynthesis